MTVLYYNRFLGFLKATATIKIALIVEIKFSINSLFKVKLIFSK